MRKLKLIWDFRGPNAMKTAEHHQMHLKEFIANQNAKVFESGFEVLNEHHTFSFLIVKEKDMRLFRDSLKPHRGEWLVD